MSAINKFLLQLTALALLLAMTVTACQKEEDDGLPITNDLRVLQVKIGSNVLTSGAVDISVIPEFLLVFSHGLNTSAFEQAFDISPAVDFTLTYDDSKSFVTISFNEPLNYEETYRLLLPQGTYGANGEASVEDFSFEFRTAPFEAPSITLSSSASSFFEGETITVTATLNRMILEDVSLDLVFAGSAVLTTDYTASATSMAIPSGSISASIELTALNDADLEGEESILITLANLVNAVESEPQALTISLGDQPPALELKGVMELDNYIDASGGRVRAIHLRALEDIPNLGIYGVEIASNGAAPDPMDIDFTFPDMVSASAGEDILVLRDEDEADAMAFFGDCFADFTVFLSSAITQNGDDAILLYVNGIAIESFGEPGVDGTGLFWEYTDSWAYKINGEWIYAGVACVENTVGAATNETSDCPYPFCRPLQLLGVSSLLWDGSGTNGGKFVHVRANRDIPDLSIYGLGVANNGGGTDGIEFTFPLASASEGDHILVAREPETISGYLGPCYNQFALVVQSDAMNQNGDDAIELFEGMTVIETFGDANVDGTGQPWDYTNTWAYRIGSWTYAGIDCGAGSTSTQSSACPYVFCN